MITRMAKSEKKLIDQARNIIKCKIRRSLAIFQQHAEIGARRKKVQNAQKLADFGMLRKKSNFMKN